MTEAELVEKLKDKHWRMNNLYFIKDKRGRKILFKYNQVQDEYQKNKHNRNIILKARQQGFTTFECINALDSCLFISYFDAGIIAHTVDDAEKIFTNKVKFAFENMPEFIKAARVPNNDRAGELRFPNGSSINVSSGYRGGTLMKLHVSEFGKICVKYPEKAREIITGAFNAVPLDGDLTVESTAEGMNGAFYELCEKAQGLDKLTPLDFKFHFFAWYESQEYRLDPIGIDISEEFKQYFKSLKDNHGIRLDDSQKAWYFKKSQEQDDDMKQEYPSYPEEAFRASGRPVFNLEKIAAAIKRTKDKTFTLMNFEVKSLVNERVFKIPVKIFKAPDKAMAYAVAGDPAEGLEDGDNSALSVLGKDFEQYAAYAGKLDPDIFGGLMVEVAKYFNGAIVAPELNNHGHAVIASIKTRKYFKIFAREVKEELGVDKTAKVGWLNTVKSKMEMIDDLIKAFRDDSLVINDEATLREMMTIVTEEDGNIIVNSKDRVVALGISIQAIKQAGLEGEFKAHVPGKTREKDVTKMTIDEKLKHYARMQKI